MSRVGLVRLVRLAVMIAASWTFLGFFFASQQRVVLLGRHEVEDTNAIIIETTAAMIVWALLTPLILWIAERLLIERPHALRNLALMLVIGIVFAITRAAIDAAVPPALEDIVLDRAGLIDVIAVGSHIDFLFFLAIAAIVNYVHLRRKSDEQHERAAQAESNLAQARLRQLRGDLQPHFLFNTLNDVAALAPRDGAAAADAMFQLADLLQRSADTERSHVRVSEELEFIRRYLALQKLRFGSRLETHIDVDDPALLSAWMPPLLLQPLVENSIVHGIRKRDDGGTVRVRASLDGDELRFEVRDTGPGCDPATPLIRGRIGVTNTVARLDFLYGRKEWLRYRREAEAFVAELRVPVHQP